MTGVVGAFFVVQIGVMAAEQRLGLGSWSAPKQDAWTFAALCPASPLFIEPVLQMFAGPS
jgi:hypothetical protein